MMAHREFWIFEVLGGQSFDMRVTGNPTMRHDGNRSIVRCLCTDEQAAELEDEMRRRGCRVRSNSPREDDEQAHERENLLAVLGGERAFPCERCPECAWFDPHLESLCGAGFAVAGRGWETSARDGAMTNQKFRDDCEACPLRRESS